MLPVAELGMMITVSWTVLQVNSFILGILEKEWATVVIKLGDIKK